MPSHRPRRRPRRLPWHDYREAGTYFISITVKHRTPALGVLTNGTVECSPLGNLVHRCWHEIETIRPWILVEDFIVMPDHLHGLLRIWRGEIESVSTAVQYFKWATTKRAGELGLWSGPLWQRGFWDRVLADSKSIEIVRRYIEQNPQQAAGRILQREEARYQRDSSRDDC